MSSPSTVFNFDAREQKIVKVIVFNDRAEIKRIVKSTLKPGFNELVLKNVTSCLIHDSLRVEGKGNAKIHDVIVKNEPVLTEDSDSEQLSVLRNVMQEKEAVLNALKDRKNILAKRLEALNLMVAQIGSGVVNPPKGEGSFELNDTTLSNIDKFFDFYSQKAEVLAIDGRNLDNEIQKANEAEQKARNDLNQHENGKRYQYATNAYITLEAGAEISIELDVIYQVHNASWTPSYDIRVDTENSKMNLSYFGKIRQHTGEDWVDAPLVLSTAKPSLGGRIPELGALDVQFYVERPRVQNFMERRMKPMMMRASGAGLFGAAPPQELRVEEDSRSLDVAVASEVTQSALSTEFKILREATIPNSTDEHKVTIGIVNLNPQLVHQTVPSKNSSAFLTASAINTSDLAFLAGQASIYLDNAFIAKTYLKDVSPGGRFDCSLGVDTGIRIEYKPAKKYHQQAGFINKQSTNVTEQTIVIKNTRANAPILITMKHHIPRSVDEKIKINLITPTATPFNAGEESNNEVVLPSEGAKLNSLNNLEWTVKVAQNSSQTLLIKYTIDHPKDEKIEFQEKF
ncbi:unnamed protein product [Caenorhabditis angaria]|uniref:Protein F37C4.5 n=1 Tax=Caenorhabditis angaria TaxID=860376 RepID=A0A9P1IF92_9PELO|nr:unnamed protein product [Caenorhabditis angaria]